MAVAQMGARFAAGDDVLARVVRDRQDAVDRWQLVDARLVKEAGEPPATRSEPHRFLPTRQPPFV